MIDVPPVSLKLSQPGVTVADDDYEYPQIFICQGPPLCGLEGDEATAFQQQGCAFCRIEELQPDGCSWAVIQDPTVRPQ